METQIWAIILVVIGSFIGGIGPIFLKWGSMKINLRDFSTIIFNKYLILGVLVYGISTLIFIPALKGGELSVLYPLVGLGYIWVCFYSKYILHERITWLKWAGISVIVLGVAFVGFGA